MDVGGQAVIEGVMMRNKEHYAVAVRNKEGKINILKEKSSKYPKYFQYPFCPLFLSSYYFSHSR